MIFDPEDEVDTIHADLGVARRRLWSLERAPYEGRVADPDAWERSVFFARQRVRDLERELAAARAELEEDAA